MDSPNPYNFDDSSVSIYQIAQFLKRRWHVILGITFLAALLATLYTFFFIKPLYVATSYLSPALFNGAVINLEQTLFSITLQRKVDRNFYNECNGVLFFERGINNLPNNIITVVYKDSDRVIVEKCSANIIDYLINSQNEQLANKKEVVQNELEISRREITELKKYLSPENFQNFLKMSSGRESFSGGNYFDVFLKGQLRFFSLQRELQVGEQKLIPPLSIEAKIVFPTILSNRSYRDGAFKIFVAIFISVLLLGIFSLFLSEYYQMKFNVKDVNRNS
jgi:hypothetical protein